MFTINNKNSNYILKYIYSFIFLIYYLYISSRFVSFVIYKDDLQNMLKFENFNFLNGNTAKTKYSFMKYSFKKDLWIKNLLNKNPFQFYSLKLK